MIETNTINSRGKSIIGKIDHLSASTILGMKTCAKAIYFKKILGLTNKTQYARTVFGLSVHYALEQYGRYYIENKEVLDKNITYTHFEKYFLEHSKEITIWGNKDTFDSMVQAGKDAINIFYEKFAYKLKPLSVECGFIIERGKNKLPIIGYQDLITEDGCIYDYKCALSSNPSKYICNMTIYAWDFFNKNKVMPKKVATIAAKWKQKDKKYYFADWEEHILPIDEKYLTYVKSECDDTEKMIDANVFNRAEAGCGLCKNCGYREECGVIIL